MKIKTLLFTILSLFVALSTLSAREEYSLNSGWRIFSAVEGSGDAARSISLPYCWSQSLSTPVSLTTANYLRNIYAPQTWRMKRVFVKFSGVQSVADVFINGKHIGEHRGGGTAFVYEISQYLKYEDDNILTVRVSSAPQNDLLPTSVEHEIYGGIYRDVELIVTPRTAITPDFYGADGLFVTTQKADAGGVSGEVAVRFVSDGSVERRVELSIVDMDGVEAFNRVINKSKIDGTSPLIVPFSIKHAKLWSPTSPDLYRVKVSINSVDKSEGQEDMVSVVTGFRTIEIAEEDGVPGAVRVNGVPTLMRGVTLYHDHPSNGGVISELAYEQDVDMVKELGANAIRSAIVPHDRYLYSLCDKQGLMVWVDTPLSRSPFFSDVAYFPTKRFEENGMQQLREIIYQNYNHPSIVMWGIFSMLNSRGDDFMSYIKELNNEAKSIDKNRPTVALSDQNGDMNTVTDLIVWRQNIGWDKGLFSDIGLWSSKLHSDWGNFRSGVMYGEEGTMAHQIDRSNLAECRTDSRKGWFPESRQSAMHETYTQVLGSDSLFWGMWLPAMFDFKSSRSELGERVNGLVSFDRVGRKDAFYLYRALWNSERPTLHIADRRARYEGGMTQTLRVYGSDTIAPIAYIGADSLEMKNVAPAQYILEDIQVSGPTKVVVKQGELSDSVELIYGSPLRARER
ncbi:MAG: glycoside hydrolase family 2 TIM barrel-domain containing protein [Rikenellaceae bacterium]